MINPLRIKIRQRMFKAGFESNPVFNPELNLTFKDYEYLKKIAKTSQYSIDLNKDNSLTPWMRESTSLKKNGAWEYEKTYRASGSFITLKLNFILNQTHLYWDAKYEPDSNEIKSRVNTLIETIIKYLVDDLRTPTEAALNALEMVKDNDSANSSAIKTSIWEIQKGATLKALEMTDELFNDKSGSTMKTKNDEAKELIDSIVTQALEIFNEK